MSRSSYDSVQASPESAKNVHPFPRSHPEKIRCVGFSLDENHSGSIAKVVEDWMSRQQRLLFLPKHSSYQVTIEEHKDGIAHHHYSAILDITISSKRWLGSSVGPTPFKAVLMAIADLRSVTLDFGSCYDKVVGFDREIAS